MEKSRRNRKPPEAEHKGTDEDQKAEETLLALKVLLIDAIENEDILEGQHQLIAEKLEGLDPKRLEEFQADLESSKKRSN